MNKKFLIAICLLSRISFAADTEDQMVGGYKQLLAASQSGRTVVGTGEMIDEGTSTNLSFLDYKSHFDKEIKSLLENLQTFKTQCTDKSKIEELSQAITAIKNGEIVSLTDLKTKVDGIKAEMSKFLTPEQLSEKLQQFDKKFETIKGFATESDLKQLASDFATLKQEMAHVMTMEAANKMLAERDSQIREMQAQLAQLKQSTIRQSDAQVIGEQWSRVQDGAKSQTKGQKKKSKLNCICSCCDC